MQQIKRALFRGPLVALSGIQTQHPSLVDLCVLTTPPMPYALRACRTPHTEGIRPAEAITLTSLVTDVTSIEVAVH